MEQHQKKTIKTTIIGYTAAIGVCVNSVVTIASSQLLGDRVPPFETNFIRFLLQLIIMTLVIIIKRKDPRVSGVKVIAVLALSSAASFSAGVFFIVSSWYLPVALVDGILVNVIIILASIAAIFLKHCNIVLPIAVNISVLGNLLMFQPAVIFPHSTSISGINSTELNCTACTWCNQTTNETMQNFTIYEIPELSEKFDNSLLGFIFCLILGSSFWLHEQINVPYLIKYIDVDVIFFWVAVGCFPFSAVLLFTSKLTILTSMYDICLVLMISLSTITSAYLIMVSVVSISPTHTALVLPCSVVMLFIVQKTILSDIHPGPGNWMEYVGLVLIIIGSLMPAVYDLMQHRSQKQEIDERTLLVLKDTDINDVTP